MVLEIHLSPSAESEIQISEIWTWGDCPLLSKDKTTVTLRNGHLY